MTRRRPNFFIIGAPKSGTTSLYYYLKSHPDVFMPVVKEPHYFSSDLDYHIHFYQTEAQYLRLFAGARNHHKAIGEASVSYISSDLAPAAMEAFNPDAKIIVLLRDLVEALYSFHMELAFRGRTGATFENNIGAAPSGDFNYYRLVQQWPARIREYQQRFGEDNVKILLFEDLVENPAAVYRETLAFLELDTSFQPEFKIYNQRPQPRSRWVTQALNHPVGRRIGQWVFTRIPLGNTLDVYQWNRKQAVYPDLAPELRHRIMQDLEPTYREIETTLHQDLSAWRKS
jgi:hypothetical protein